MAVVVGLDIGNGWTKAHDGARSVLLPSVAGPGIAISFRSGLATAPVDDVAIEIDGRQWFAGELAVRQSPHPVTPRARDRSSEILRVLMLAALHRLDIRDGIGLRVVTGLPLAWYKPADIEQMRLALEGVHCCLINGRPREWRVEAVDVFPQPFGTLAYEVLRPGGDTRLASSTVGIIDIGTLTTNLALFANLEYIEARSTSVEAGMGLAYSLVAREIAERWRVELSPQAAETATRKGSLQIRGELHILDGIAGRALAAVTDAILAPARQLWSDGGQVDRVPLTGGGAHPLASRLKAQFPQSVVVSQAQFANAIGFWLYGALV